MSAAISALSEASDYLTDFERRCRSQRWFGALLHVGVAQDIVADAHKEQAQISATAYSAEQADLEARKLIEDTIADGVVTVDEIKNLKAAIRNIRRSAEADRKITELAAV